jgi:pimeloyl-CoA dehydrogenase small subunit
MDFDFSDDQRLLKDSLDKLVADRYGFQQRREHAAGPDGWSRAMWAQFAELGLLGVTMPEEYGGFGGGAVETMIVMEAFGRALVLEPYLATVVLGAGLVAEAGSAEQRREILPAVAAGKRLLAFAQVERGSRYDLADVTTTARQASGGWVVDGQKGVVLHGDAADLLLVTARTAGERHDRDGVGLFLVPAGATGVTRRGYPTQDGLRAAEIAFAGAASVPVGPPGGALPAIERVVDRAIAALCAEAVGVMQAMHGITVDYLKQRRQFGRAIGEFQVLQHRAVDMYVALEQARSMALYATVMADAAEPSGRRRAISAAKVQIGQSGRHIGQEAIQLHGGIAMTMEYVIGHYFRRMTMIETLFGDTATHLANVASSGSLFLA